MASSDSRLESPGGFSWNVLAGSLEYDGLGALLQLATEVTKAQLREIQSMITSSALAD